MTHSLKVELVSDPSAEVVAAHHVQGPASDYVLLRMETSEGYWTDDLLLRDGLAEQLRPRVDSAVRRMAQAGERGT